MRAWLHKIEEIVDKLIPFLLVLLLAIIILEFGFHDISEKYHIIIQVLDWFIVFIFVVDLIFKYLKSKSFPKFLRASWIDILAVFPFFLVFRAVEGILGVFEIGETLGKTQKVVHVGVELEKEIGGAIREGERIAKEASRAEKFGEFLRPVSRSFRFFKFGNKEVRDETERQAREIVKEAAKGERIIEKSAKKGTNLIENVEEKVIKGQKIVEDKLDNTMEKLPRHVKAALFYEKPKIMDYVKERIGIKYGKKHKL